MYIWEAVSSAKHGEIVPVSIGGRPREFWDTNLVTLAIHVRDRTKKLLDTGPVNYVKYACLL